MDKMKTSEIIQSCIDLKWKLILNGEGGDNGRKDCLLCHHFFDIEVCFDCPIEIHDIGCGKEDSRYADFCEAMDEETSQAMIDMLERIKEIYVKQGD